MDNGIDINIGCVIYTETNNDIKAEWLFRKNNKIESGVGIGRRVTKLNEKRRFEGAFEVTYVNMDGKKSPKLNLIISFDSRHYNLTWSINEKTTDMGIGFESDGKLIASYAKVI